MKKTIEDMDLYNKQIFLRLDLNVPIENGIITDDYRIKKALPTINYLLDHKIKSLLIASHLGRPKGYQKELSLLPIYNYLKPFFETRKLDLKFINFYDNPAQYTLFENMRFLKEEESCQNLDTFQKYITQISDILVIDAFGVVHRKAASLTETTLKAYAGLLIKEELKAVEMFNSKFDLIILGGKKVDDKILLVKNCVKKCRKIFFGGGMCKPFFNNKKSDEIEEILRIAEEYKTEILLPVDFVVKEGQNYVNTESYTEDFVDLGIKTQNNIENEIKDARSVFWNGPVGIFEIDGSSQGTRRVARAMLQPAKSIIGGGDTVSALWKFDMPNKYTHVSTGGGSLLALIEGRTLRGIDIIEDK